LGNEQTHICGHCGHPYADLPDEFGTYVANNSDGIVNYGERYRCGDRNSTGFVESAVKQAAEHPPDLAALVAEGMDAVVLKTGRGKPLASSNHACSDMESIG
jgi:hypothetical protein